MGVLGIDGIDGEELHGRGAFGSVYRARQPRLRRDVAVKVLGGAFDDAALQRFERECATIGSLSGEPGILTVYDAGRTPQGSPFLVMPLMEGGSLADRLSAGPLPVDDVVAHGIDVGRALAAAHRRGVLHLDVKPGNIMLDARGRPHLGDFGIARFIDAEQAGHTATVAGTPGFAAPEIFDGRPPTVASDVYGLGATLHALASGRAPFTLSEAGGLNTLLDHIAHRPPPDLRPLGVPDPLCRVIERALAKDPADRFPTADDLVTALEAVAGDGADRTGRAAGATGPGGAPPPEPPVAAGGTGADAAEPRTVVERRPSRRRGRRAGVAGRPAVTPGAEHAGTGSGGVPPSDEPPTHHEVRRRGRTRPPPPARQHVAGGRPPSSERQGDPGADHSSDGGTGGRRRPGTSVLAVGALLVAAGAVAAAVALPADDPTDPSDQVLDTAPSTTTEPAPGVGEPVLQAWLQHQSSVNEGISLLPVREAQRFACTDALTDLPSEFGELTEEGSLTMPADLAEPVARLPEPLRGAWVDAIDGWLDWLTGCAGDELTPELSADLQDRYEATQIRLFELYARAAGASTTSTPADP